MLFRDALTDLEQWHSQTPRKPLILRGARQVGKTTLVRLFCERQDLHLVEVNLESDFEIRSAFKSMDPEAILRDIELLKKTRINKKSLLFIDEIQACPEAIQALRYFYEKKVDLPVVAAGSLLEFILSEHTFSMPVGRVEYFFVHPMKFGEFLRAQGETPLIKAFQTYKIGHSISDLFHERLLKVYYEYLLVGGMPEAVSVFVKTKNLTKVKAVHRTIMLNYQSDFAKYAKRIPVARLEKVFSFTPAHIGQKARFSEMDPDEQAKSLRLALDLLEKAGVIYRIYHSNASGIPLKIGIHEGVFKLLFVDIGLVSYDLGLAYEDVLEIYNSTKGHLNLLHKGLITEQFVGQQLLATHTLDRLDLFYWLRERRAQNAEVDFLIQKGLHIIPIEVKFGKTGSIKSLIQFVKEKKARLGIKFTTQPPHVEESKYEDLNFRLLRLPVYLAERIFDIIETSHTH